MSSKSKIQVKATEKVRRSPRKSVSFSSTQPEPVTDKSRRKRQFTTEEHTLNETTPRTLLDNVIQGHDTVHSTTRKRPRLQRSPAAAPGVQRFSPRQYQARQNSDGSSPDASINTSRKYSPNRSISLKKPRSLRKKATMRNFLVSDNMADGPTPRTMIAGILATANEETPAVGTRLKSADSDGKGGKFLEESLDKTRDISGMNLSTDSFLSGYPASQPFDRLQTLRRRSLRNRPGATAATFGDDIRKELTEEQLEMMNSTKKPESTRSAIDFFKDISMIDPNKENRGKATTSNEPEGGEYERSHTTVSDRDDMQTRQISGRERLQDKNSDNSNEQTDGSEMHLRMTPTPPPNTVTEKREASSRKLSVAGTDLSGEQGEEDKGEGMEDEGPRSEDEGSRSQSGEDEGPRSEDEGSRSQSGEDEVPRSEDEGSRSQSEEDEVPRSESGEDEEVAETAEPIVEEEEDGQEHESEEGPEEDENQEVEEEPNERQDQEEDADIEDEMSNRDRQSQDVSRPQRDNLVDKSREHTGIPGEGEFPSSMIDDPQPSTSAVKTPLPQRLTQLKITELFHSPARNTNVLMQMETESLSSSFRDLVHQREEAQPKKPATKPRAPRTNAKKRPTAVKAPSLPTSVTKSIFQHFSKMTAGKQVMEEVEIIAAGFWKRVSSDLTAYAGHASRSTIYEKDVEMLMRRQGFINEKSSLNSLIENHLSLEYREELIPIARSGNVVERKA